MKELLKILLLTLSVLLFKSVNAQHDADSLKNILLVWNLDENFNEKMIEYNDSNLVLFHKSNIENKHSILSSNLGNMGSASITDNFFKRYDYFENSFSYNDPFFIYLKNSQNVNYFNTRRPYTSIMHTTSTKVFDIQTIDFIHTQNVNPNFNFAFDFDFSSSLGQYINQQSKISSIGFTTNYKKNRYLIYGSFSHNKINNQNTGGYIKDQAITLDVPQPYIESASTTIYNQDLSVTNKYLFGNYKNLSYKDTIIKVLEPTISFSHNINLFRNYRIYYDEESESSSIYYDDIFFQDNFSLDSIGERGVSNKIEIGSENNFEKKNKFGFSIIYDGTFKQIYNFKDYIFLQNYNSYFENSITGKIFTGVLSKTYFNIFAKYYFSGYRTADYRISLDIKRFLFNKFPKTFISANAKYTDQKPEYFMQNFYSNHFFWENIFLNTKTIKGNLSFEMPEKKLKASFYAALITNYKYYGLINDQIQPVEYDKDIYVLQGSIEKNFNFKRFNIHNKVIWQQSSNDSIIALPMLAGYHSTYLKFNYNNTLTIHFGVDIYYSTEYKAKNFNPAIGQFYFKNDTSQTTGNYPYMNIFANMKIKKNVQLYLKFEHVNSKLFGDLYPTYINNYPLNGRLFRFGVRWTFKN